MREAPDKHPMLDFLSTDPMVALNSRNRMNLRWAMLHDILAYDIDIIVKQYEEFLYAQARGDDNIISLILGQHSQN